MSSLAVIALIIDGTLEGGPPLQCAEVGGRVGTCLALPFCKHATHVHAQVLDGLQTCNLTTIDADWDATT